MKDLIRKIIGKGYYVYMDNFFLSFIVVDWCEEIGKECLKK